MFTMKKPAKIQKLEEELEEARKVRDAEIRRLYAMGGWTYKELAERYNLTKQRIQKIIEKGEG